MIELAFMAGIVCGGALVGSVAAYAFTEIGAYFALRRMRRLP